MRKLSFKKEAEKHIANLPVLRSAADCKLISSFEIDCVGADTFILIPCHVKEQGLYESLMAYVDSGFGKNFRIVVFLNGGPDLSKKDYANLRKRRKTDIKRAEASWPALQIQVFSNHFKEAATLSRIRGIITDALIRCCYEQKIKDPILVSNDADALSYSKNYLKLIRNAFRKTGIDFLSGTIFWTGCDEEGKIMYSPPVPLPEVYLNDLLGQSGDEVYREYGSVYSSGCNSAFRLATVAAIHGYDYEYAPFFDVEIGNQLKQFRLRDEAANPEHVFSKNGNQESSDEKEASAAFLADCVLSTNPRRAILAFLNGVPYGEQFDSVATILGADLSLETYTTAYINNKTYIQQEDLLAYPMSTAAQEKLHERITINYLHFLQGEPTRNKVAFTRLLCEKAGLAVAAIKTYDPNPDREISEAERELSEEQQRAYVKSRLQISEIEFDWSKSSLPRKLVAWIKHNSSTR